MNVEMLFLRPVFLVGISKNSFCQKRTCWDIENLKFCFVQNQILTMYVQFKGRVLCVNFFKPNLYEHEKYCKCLSLNLR